MEKVKMVNRRVENGVIIEDYKGISKVAEELGISRVAVYKHLKL